MTASEKKRIADTAKKYAQEWLKKDESASKLLTKKESSGAKALKVK